MASDMERNKILMMIYRALPDNEKRAFALDLKAILQRKAPSQSSTVAHQLDSPLAHNEKQAP